ncbi:hypothetical protein [Bathymodiolus thermophilus thioautotrophic gill symbiont]|uniref:hypothetical protein n=1 Tax=Bathymodiolus thermophilus thioautotrophic gill symbiont TaxID=2360 RepID=UPI000F0952B1|nr:hypothetical protein [Bathymodiolus thermophilus thioautotrophic gill symbiont]
MVNLKKFTLKNEIVGNKDLKNNPIKNNDELQKNRTMITTGNIQKCTPHLQVIMQSTKCQLAIEDPCIAP